ncbi:MAG: hypothetical protein VKK04_09440 [Synechococcales bacterium]|nr:hypothetical protein [Synechococcales bacterium]
MQLAFFRGEALHTTRYHCSGGDRRGERWQIILIGCDRPRNNLLLFHESF